MARIRWRGISFISLGHSKTPRLQKLDTVWSGKFIAGRISLFPNRGGDDPSLSVGAGSVRPVAYNRSQAEKAVKTNVGRVARERAEGAEGAPLKPSFGLTGAFRPRGVISTEPGNCVSVRMTPLSAESSKMFLQEHIVITLLGIR